jgi:hypothetical protein
VILWLPGERAAVEKEATPLLPNVCVERVFDPSRKATVPVGVPVVGATAAAVAVKVTDWPLIDGLLDEVSVTDGDGNAAWAYASSGIDSNGTAKQIDARALRGTLTFQAIMMSSNEPCGEDHSFLAGMMPTAFWAGTRITTTRIASTKVTSISHRPVEDVKN